MTFATLILGLVTLQRTGELVLARSNTKRLLGSGATEAGADHYPWLVIMHAAWLIALWIFGYQQPVNPYGLGIFAVLQLLRVWIIGTLGRRWTTRIIVPPSATPIASGPYRYLSHPNYVVVACEIAVLPLTLGLPLIAIVFSCLNALILMVRINAENRALAACRQPG